MRRTFLLSAVAIVVAAWAGGPCRADQFSYGIDEKNNLLSINVSTGSSSVLANLSSTLGGSASNALAFDAGRNRLLFLSPESGKASLYSYDLAANSLSVLASGTTAVPTPAASAAFYNGSYWYVQNNTNTLVQVKLDATTGAYASTSKSVLNTNAPNSKYGFGDIVITSSGLMYGSTDSRFFSVQVNSDGSTRNFTIRTVPGGGNLQLTLGPNGVLYGYQHENSSPNAQDRGWYTVNTTPGTSFGDRSYLGYKTDGPSIRDLSDTVVAAVPEPSSLAICALGGLAMAWRLRRRSTRDLNA